MGSIHSLGLTAKKEEQFRKKGITTTKELAAFFPRRYLDMRQGKLLLTVTEGYPGNYLVWQYRLLF